MEIVDENDPLFGVIPESHLGLDPLSGKPKIAKEVLEGMRAYLAVPEGPEKIARMERVRKSIEDLGNDPIGQKTMLMNKVLLRQGITCAALIQGQYQEAIVDDVSPSTVYGAEHLLRLFGKISVSSYSNSEDVL
ncbi:hypothetical protein F2Q69_00008836 [Brassica cretica]|uniref:Uncharacterized protein n=1 Tax=Brassica cretica TaxID=69181 RepID=A0A8S9PAW4_BRACR|nr:hypothetical protein F2Q69_00008836 [Brassica cretica]